MKILAYCDSLAEPNPGEMEGGIWAKDENDKVLFMKTVSMGHGTCNQAEYYALIHLLTKLKEVTKPGDEITIHSDSQLMTKQLNGLWRVTKGDIKALYKKVMMLREDLPFTIKWVPRENNAIADALAQENRLKGSGRSAMMEDGRFRVKRYTPCVELLGDKQMAKMLHNNRLIELKENVEGELLKQKVDYGKIVNRLKEMQSESTRVLEHMPHINNLADKWVKATIEMLNDNLEDFIHLANKQPKDFKDAFSEFFNHLHGSNENE